MEGLRGDDVQVKQWSRVPAETGGSRRLGDRAYLRLRALMTDGVIPAQTVIRETDLARRLGMSRTPIREALRRLEAEGVIRYGPEGAYELVELTTNELADVYDVRAHLEGYAARLAATNRSRGALGEMQDLVEEIDIALEGHNYELVTSLNRRFHDVIARAGGNKYLEAVLREVRDLYERYRPAALSAPGRRDMAHQEHHRLVQVIEARDADEAETIAKAHAMTGLSALLESRADTDRIE